MPSLIFSERRHFKTALNNPFYEKKILREKVDFLFPYYKLIEFKNYQKVM